MITEKFDKIHKTLKNINFWSIFDFLHHLVTFKFFFFHENFTTALETVLSRHEQTVETMAHALIEYRLESGELNSEELDRQLTRFLDRFFMSRIGIRLLINQHITLFAGYNNRLKTHLLGTFDKQTNIREVIENAYHSAEQLCHRNYMDCPKSNIKVANNTDLAGESAMEICYSRVSKNRGCIF